MVLEVIPEVEESLIGSIKGGSWHLTVKSKLGNSGGEPENDRQSYKSSPPKFPSLFTNYINLTILRPKIPAKVSGLAK